MRRCPLESISRRPALLMPLSVEALAGGQEGSLGLLRRAAGQASQRHQGLQQLGGMGASVEEEVDGLPREAYWLLVEGGRERLVLWGEGERGRLRDGARVCT